MISHDPQLNPKFQAKSSAKATLKADPIELKNTFTEVGNASGLPFDENVFRLGEDVFSKLLKNHQKLLVIGVDEAGRGCMFGPVVTAAACIGFVDYSAARIVADMSPSLRLSNILVFQRRVSQDLLMREEQEVKQRLTPEEHKNMIMQQLFKQRAPTDSVFVQDYADAANVLLTPINPIYNALQIQLDLSQSKDMINYVLKDQDSKKLSEKRRQSLYQEFVVQGEKGSIIYAIEEGSVSEIDEHNILNATLKAMERAVNKVLALLQNRCKIYGINWKHVKERIVVVFDGNNVPKITDDQVAKIAAVKGDLRVREVSVASILAKTYRDNLMEDLSNNPNYAMYNLAKHKGYVTSEHVGLLMQYGPSDLHRKEYKQVRMAIELHGKKANQNNKSQ
ncbi:ribonuclease HII [Psittacicella hinzii]|uniref:Ribonuclease n=1 Tax=Psittacicella hinzii TaxID=2028575 RepID=A0A3A1YPB7_9GAMM|nr:ribonuclease HII [Psittacicella hinzii]RIY38800.1 hypothetical protein CKF58_03215 [Psittacicella hinzii]